MTDRRRAPKLSPELRADLGDDLRKEYEAGASIRGLAEARGWSYGYVSDLLHEAGAPIRPAGWAAGRGRARPTVRDVARLRGLLARACDALDDHCSGDGDRSEFAAALRKEGGITPSRTADQAVSLDRAPEG